jgi:DNA-binding FadR family transcriptional regulator
VRALDEAQLRAYFTHAVTIERLPFREIMEARKPIEVQSARLAASRRTPDQLEAMQDVVRKMRRNLSNADAYVDLDHELHRQIAEASGNVIIMHLIGSLRGALNDLTHNTLYRRRNRQQLERVHVLHEAIVNAIGYRNADAAGQAMDVHFSEALSFLIQRQEGVRKG